MKQYLETLKQIVEQGSWKDSRTGYRCLMMPGMMMRFDLTEGFPAVTTKKLAWENIKGELVGFLRGYTNAADFRKLGCKVWDGNANDPGLPGSPNAWLANAFREGVDDLGAIYGDQWRNWPGYKVIDETEPDFEARCRAAEAADYRLIGNLGGYQSPRVHLYYKQIDQIADCFRKIHSNPNDRRILFHAWNPSKLDEMALPPCHLLYQFIPNPATKELNMCLYIRSNDMFLGSPFNIAEGALLLELMAHLTGYTAKWFTYFIGDAHIYENHLEAVKTQLTRTPHPLPRLLIDPRIPRYADTGIEQPQWLDECEPRDFQLVGYTHDDPIKAVMAV